MQIWLDTINLDVIAEGTKTGIISGVTTNPTILSRAKNVPETLHTILDMQPGPLAVQVTSQSADDMIDEGRAIFRFSKRLIVKIPVNGQGLIAIKQLSKENSSVLGTAVLHPTQAMLAAHQDSTWISPYFSHIGTFADSYESLKTMVNIVQSTQTKILVASLKSLDDLIYCALLGVDAVTIKDDLYYKLVEEHPLFEKFSQKFLSDWKEAHGNISIQHLLENQCILYE